MYRINAYVLADSQTDTCIFGSISSISDTATVVGTALMFKLIYLTFKCREPACCFEELKEMKNQALRRLIFLTGARKLYKKVVFCTLAGILSVPAQDVNSVKAKHFISLEEIIF